MTALARGRDEIVAVDVADVRFPTSRNLDGSDALNPHPDYSAAYVAVRTSSGEEGYGLVFTLGRGTDVQAAAVRAIEPLVVGWPVDDLRLGRLSRRLTGDSPMRWLGPEKGVVHMAVAGVLNAVWDLYARRAGQPLWRMVSQLTPERLVDLVDFRYLHDVLSRDEALELLRCAEPGREQRTNRLLSHGYPAYTSSPGWIGYDDTKLVRLCRRAVADGFTHLKLKVGRSLPDDIRRVAMVRESIGPDVKVALDANQAWGVDEAISWVDALKPFDPYWIEEPTSPDDVLGHAAIRRAVAPVRVATGEHVHNRVMFKQLLQAGAIDVVQIDACRVGGVNENLAIMLMAAKYGVPVCPHAGGVGLCEMVQHLAMIDFVAVSGTMTGRVIEYVDHLHEHFTDPVILRDGHYLAPRAPGFSTRLRVESLAEYGFPDGPVWRAERMGPDELAGATT